jgi:hypothetical protein
MIELNKLIPEYLIENDIETLNSLSIEEKNELKTLFPRKSNFLNLEIMMNGKRNLQKGSYQSFANYEVLGYDVKIIGLERLPNVVQTNSVFSKAIQNEQPLPVEKVVLSAIEDEVVVEPIDKLEYLLDSIEESIDKLEDKIELSENKIDTIIKNTTPPKQVTDKTPKPKAKRTTKKIK